MAEFGDTIVAAATPPGGGLVALVRVSGPRAVELAGGLPGAVVSRAPRSYTREDVVEVRLPGAPSLVDRLVRDLCAAGARTARPGEFTLRAFLNGRIDLAQAEAVGRLVAAEDEEERRAALRQVGGEFSRRLAAVESRILDLAADVEASLDFSDRDIELLSPADAARRAGEALAELRALSADAGAREVRDGRPIVVLLGRPNAGKSSLFNALAGADAITSPVPGTTRDALAADVDLGLPVRLLDLPGIPGREAAGAADAEAARRAAAVAASADLALVVTDIADPAGAADFEPRGVPRLRVWSKADLGTGAGEGVRTSARTGQGLDDLRRAVRGALDAGSGGTQRVSLRQKALLREAEGALERSVRSASEGMELGALDLRAAAGALGGISGRDVGEELLDRVFGRFCLGK